MLDRVMTRLELEIDLRKALENQQFVVYYQPILDMVSKRIIGFEALVRWQHPTKGLIPPADFIPAAEETGIIIPLGYWILDEACHQIHAWNSQYSFDPPLTINVNLSSRQCEQPDLVQKISDILRKNRLDASQLKLELTESLVIKDSEHISKMLSDLRELGIQVQIDDFGTGYSSLSYLHTLPIDTLKIDRSFINRLGGENNGAEIVQTIISLAHNLGMKVIAEGVEKDDQFNELSAMDCEYMQGFLFSKAVDSPEAGAMLGKLIDTIEGEDLSVQSK
jgi:EAL domain-containing protein (putative c-di-GMP-specific phosphodiesterase class I)